VHAPDGCWLVGDFETDPNGPSTSVSTLMSEVVEVDESIAGLASMPPRHIAQRAHRAADWRIEALLGWD
jgi:hypothetical protein